MIRAVTWIMIAVAVLLSPAYLLWIAGGKLADMREKRRGIA